jgi:DNA-binding MarR family transcriptional regulator
MQSSLGTELAARRTDVLAGCVCTNLRTAARVVTHRFDQALAPSGLRMTQLALLLACAAPGPTTIAQVASALAVDRTTLSRTLRPLARQGLIAIGRGRDRRARQITMTDHGRNVLSAALPLWANAEHAIAEQLGWEDLGHLLAALARVVAIGEKS